MLLLPGIPAGAQARKKKSKSVRAMTARTPYTPPWFPDGVELLISFWEPRTRPPFSCPDNRAKAQCCSRFLLMNRGNRNTSVSAPAAALRPSGWFSKCLRGYPAPIPAGKSKPSTNRPVPLPFADQPNSCCMAATARSSRCCSLPVTSTKGMPDCCTISR